MRVLLRWFWTVFLNVPFVDRSNWSAYFFSSVARAKRNSMTFREEKTGKNHFTNVIQELAGRTQKTITWKSVPEAIKNCSSRFFTANLFLKIFAAFFSRENDTMTVVAAARMAAVTVAMGYIEKHETFLQKFLRNLSFFAVCLERFACNVCERERAHALYNCCANYNFIKFVNLRFAVKTKVINFSLCILSFWLYSFEMKTTLSTETYLFAGVFRVLL